MESECFNVYLFVVPCVLRLQSRHILNLLTPSVQFSCTSSEDSGCMKNRDTSLSDDNFKCAEMLKLKS